jgi:hypothetical protein
MSVKKVPGSVRSFRENDKPLSAVVTAGQALTAQYQLLMANDAQRLAHDCLLSSDFRTRAPDSDHWRVRRSRNLVPLHEIAPSNQTKCRKVRKSVGHSVQIRCSD